MIINNQYHLFETPVGEWVHKCISIGRYTESYYVESKKVFTRLKIWFLTIDIKA